MTLYSYVVARDFGFAPNPFYGFCTLATCKPRIRGRAAIGDWVVGTGSRSQNRGGHLVYAMRVTETISFDEFWIDSRFRRKRPNLLGSKKQAFGDNIYHHNQTSGDWVQENSHHALKDGGVNERNVANDTSVPRVLVSDDYIYWGGGGPQAPQALRNHEGFDIYAGRGYKCIFPDSFVAAVVDWIRSQPLSGYAGRPLDWAQSP